ncbi:MAG: phosphoribosyl-AMP cyclohydrolase [Chloroflexi bacterium]|nr:phosphoribosyl-AMP cyclohydrolase [Chloroflexota bacterium]
MTSSNIWRREKSPYDLQESTMNNEMQVNFDKHGLIPAVLQDSVTNMVLMVAWMNSDALKMTQESGEAHFWSRSRQELWHKGATSGNTMRVDQVLVDCDSDTLLLRVAPNGPACHTGEKTCFYREVGSP